MHWLNALAVVVLMMNGWRVYNATPLRFRPTSRAGLARRY
jgi:Ni,Fe-hydrogenase I cytochrome b subunit